MSERAKILRLIMENQHILFGRHCNKKLNLELKTNKWKEIAEQSYDLGILDSTKDWKHLRDILWQNWRKRSLKKFASRKKNSADASKKYRLDSNDKLILQILKMLPRETSEQYKKRRKLFTDTKKATEELENKILELKMKIIERDCYLKDLELLEKETNEIMH